uniref:TBC1 domain family member 10C n=1 Tax=Latimeria chalumnae TaxID=7897 RepID=H3B1A6_LATCH
DTMSLSSTMEELSDTLDSALDTRDDSSSLGSDSEINGAAPYRQTDKYGFIGASEEQEGFLFSSLSPEVIRHREMKWIDMIGQWEKFMNRKHKKVKIQCRKGIPSSLRARCWPLLCGAQAKMDQNKNRYQELDAEPGDKQWIDTIEKDIHRQFPFHEMFISPEGHGQQGLLRVLKAYTVYRPEEGYCQAQGPVAAVLLMQMPVEQAFWCLVQICEQYLPGYYSPGLEAVQLDGLVLVVLLKKTCPVAYKHLKKHSVDPLLYVTEWFLCLFARTLPFPTVLRVWDMFFSEGVKVLFRVALVLLKIALGSSEKLRDCQGLVETLEKLRNIPAKFLQEDFLIQEVCDMALSEREIDKVCRMQLRKKRGELKSGPSSGRLHGAKAIFEHQRQEAELARASMAVATTTTVMTTAATMNKKQKSIAADEACLLNKQVPLIVIEEASPQVSPAKKTREERRRERQEEKERERQEKERARQEKERLKSEREMQKRLEKEQQLEEEQRKSAGKKPATRGKTFHVNRKS